MCVLTLYGFDQARHEAMTAKWRAWFEANFDKVEVPRRSASRGGGSAPSKRRARERVGESEGRSPSVE
jgi:hypothetical protein